MSYEIINQITIDKEVTKFKVKCDSNNVFPRHYTWSPWLEIECLYFHFISGSFQNGNKGHEKLAIVDYLTHNIKYDGDYYKDYLNNSCGELEGESKEKFDIFNKQFIEKLRNVLKNDYSTKKEHIISFGDRGYLYKKNKHSLYRTHTKMSAKKMSKYCALNLAQEINMCFNIDVEKVININTEQSIEAKQDYKKFLV